MPAIYPRIANPWMPNGTPNLTNSPTPLYAPGELGKAFNDQNTGLSYLRVICDSGATSATTIGVVKAGQLAFWKDRGNSIVTNDYNFNDTGTPASCVNRIAGVFQTAVTAGNYCDLMIAGINQPVASLEGSTCVPGYQVISDTTTNIGTGGGVKCLASATTAPTQQVVGICRSSGVSGGAGGGGLMNVDVALGFID